MAKTFVSDKERLIEYIRDDPELKASCSQLGINFSERDLYELQWDISVFPKLQSVDLHKNNFSEIPECIRSLKHLKKLNMSHNMLNDIPEWISELRDLELLNLSSNKGINTIPSEISELKCLDRLILSNCSIDIVPDCIYEIKTLRQIRLDNNKLNSLPLCSVERNEHYETLVMIVRTNPNLSLERFPEIQKVIIFDRIIEAARYYNKINRIMELV